MHTDPTLTDIYDEIADKLALARTKALMGERCEALGILQAAHLEYTRFRDVLQDFPGFRALEHAYHITTTALRTEQQEAETVAPVTTTKATTRKRSRRAA